MGSWMTKRSAPRKKKKKRKKKYGWDSDPTAPHFYPHNLIPIILSLLSLTVWQPSSWPSLRHFHQFSHHHGKERLLTHCGEGTVPLTPWHGIINRVFYWNTVMSKAESLFHTSSSLHTKYFLFLTYQGSIGNPWCVQLSTVFGRNRRDSFQLWGWGCSPGKISSRQEGWAGTSVRIYTYSEWKERSEHKPMEITWPCKPGQTQHTQGPCQRCGEDGR